MDTKIQILNLLESHRGSFFSGNEIAQKLGVSRTAVWKAINSLKISGYQILSVTNKGYCLSTDTDVISFEGIASKLPAKLQNAIKIEVFDSIDSTNTYLKLKASDGSPEGTVAVSGEQTVGRGRRGRDFYSPKGSGVYFSVVLRPAENLKDPSCITTMAATAVCEAIEEVFHKEPKIKWVNDIFMDGKKVCGILTEAAFDMESGSIEYAILGIGINVYGPPEGFPDEIKKVAGSVLEKPEGDAKNRLVAGVISSFFKYYNSKNPMDYLQGYKSRSLAIGRNVEIIGAGRKQSQKALAVDIDNECHLIVEYEDKTREALSSGEISIKL